MQITSHTNPGEAQGPIEPGAAVFSTVGILYNVAVSD